MKKLFSYMMVCGAMMTAVLGFTSCEDDLDVQQAYPFTVETMPVPKRLVQGETAEIRCEIVREGYFSDTRYTIRYFQRMTVWCYSRMTAIRLTEMCSVCTTPRSVRTSRRLMSISRITTIRYISSHSLSTTRQKRKRIPQRVTLLLP